jgi:V/A-type H+-transporting ATPase subunit D
VADLAGLPPGRAGRNWLRRRLATAERGREQLDRKLRVLFPEQQRLAAQAARHRAEWVSACADADAWLVRAALLGGQDGLRGATSVEPVSVLVRWTTSMGLSYPCGAELSPWCPDPPIPGGNAAVGPATTAFRAAVLAGARTAAAEEGVRRVEAEIALTRRRLRALEKRWLPSLRRELVGLELALEQTEQDDALRLRRATAALPQKGELP